jgi:hypothetical protein
MKTARWAILALMATTWISCVASILPLFEDRVLVSEPGLLGAWTGGKSADAWTFEKAEGREYLLTLRQAEYEPGQSIGNPSKKVPGDAVRFRARLGRLGPGLFLDLVPADKGNPEIRNDVYNASMIPGHLLARIWLERDSLRIVFLDQEWLTDAVKDGWIVLAHVQTESWLVLTAPTAELQAAILKFGENEKAFPLADIEEFHRSK